MHLLDQAPIAELSVIMLLLMLWTLFFLAANCCGHPTAVRRSRDTLHSRWNGGLSTSPMYLPPDRRDARFLYYNLRLQSHFEGGSFRETWRGDRYVTFTRPTNHTTPRTTGTSIYYLLEDDSVLVWHKLLSDVVYVWHAGGTLKLHFLSDDGTYSTRFLGDTLRSSYVEYQVAIPHDTWYAAEIVGRKRFVLFGEVVCPGFEYEDYTEGTYTGLVADFPQHEQVIKELTTA